MELKHKKLTADEAAAARKARLGMQNLQAIEGNPLDAEQIALFEMFERERWSHEDRHAYVMDWARKVALESKA